MGAEREMFATLKSEFGKRPVMSNVVFGFLQAGVEKMLEVEFACPCNPTWNSIFVAPFFLIPAITASGLMLLIHGSDTYKNILCSFLPLVIWLALMLLNGQYVVCAKTDWPGTFVSTEDTYLKWCKPTNETMENELLNRSHRFYILSQGVGNCIVSCLLVALIVYMACTRSSRQNEKCDKPSQTEEEVHGAESTPLQHLPEIQ